MNYYKILIPIGLIGAIYMISKTNAVQNLIVEFEAPTDAPTIETNDPDISIDSNPWKRFDKWFNQYGSQYNVNPQWLKAIALNESSLGAHPSVVLGMLNPSDPASASDDGLSYGLMQFTLPTARDFMTEATMVELNDPETAIKLAAQLVRRTLGQFVPYSGEELMHKVIISYNQGAGRTLKGQDFTGDYYPRFLRNLALVQSRDA